MYFFVHMSNFILQNFEELDRVVRKSIILSKTQKMSKREQRKKIALVSQQISDLKDRVAKLESCLRTLEQDPDQYFQNLNPDNREYIEWKKISLPSEKRQENNSSTEEKKEDRGATAASSGRSVHFGFFSALIGHFHTAASTTPTWESSRSSSSYGHTAPGYYSSYTHTSGGSVSFPSVGALFSALPQASQSSSASSAPPSPPPPPPPPPVPAPRPAPTHYSGCLCADCVNKYLHG